MLQASQTHPVHHTTLMDIPPELLCASFLRAGCVLRGCMVSKQLKRILRGCGSEAKPLFLLIIASCAMFSDFLAISAFIKSFRHCVVLVVSLLFCLSPAWLSSSCSCF